MMEQSTQTTYNNEGVKREKVDQKVLTHIHQKKIKKEQDKELDYIIH